jgi:hypothetical protein
VVVLLFAVCFLFQLFSFENQSTSQCVAMFQDKISHQDQQLSNEIKDDLSITFLQTTDSSKLNQEETNQKIDQFEKEIRSNSVKLEISKSLNQEETNQRKKRKISKIQLKTATKEWNIKQK